MAVVVVTGSSGKLGRAVVEHLVAHGHEVVTTDRTPPPPGQPGSFTKADLTDLGQVIELLTGVDERYDHVDAVVHLAAIPAPGLFTSGATFANNVPSTFNVFQAAKIAGIRKVVWASSETVLGLPFEVPPPYVPVDEEYRVRPNSTYSVGKAVEEELAAHFARWDPELSIIALRFSNVMAPEDYTAFEGWQEDPEARRWNLWGYIDARDGAQAVRRGLELDRPGCEVCVVANADTVMSRSSASLMAEVFPGVEVRRELTEHETLLCIDKAHRLLGYQPEHSWRDHVALPAAQTPRR